MRSKLDRVDSATLCRLLGSWTEKGANLPGLLADALSELITSGALREGAVLPSQRELATALGIARGTVATAYEILESREHVCSYPGSGSRVRRRGIDPAASLDGRLASFTRSYTPLLDFSSGALPALPRVGEAIDRLDRDVVAAELATDGYYPAGLPRLRSAIADRYTRDGLPTEERQILITSGSQQAVWLICHVFVGHGDEVIVEDPTYRGALEALSAVGARMMTVPVTDDGLDVDHLARALTTRRPRLLYCQPRAHNPTGASMPAAAGHRLAELVEHHGLLTVEDGSNADLMLGGHRLRPVLGGIGPESSVVSIGTTSKLFWGGMRVGWIRGSVPIITRLTEAKKAIDLASAVLEQLIAAELILRADEAREERAVSLQFQLNTTEQVVGERRPDWKWTRPTGGTGLWIDTGADAVALAERASRRGVRIVPGPAFSAYGAFRRYLRLPIWHPRHDLQEALNRLDL
ncbi:PLP-dependent aminotransferase family protein [Streptomyces sp. NPDC056716]|uniref:aminotransferase-like domain-containing protein n=1 Tax=unclassified Streptomyces TaxID=2593676 RepID=UPI0036C01D62